MVLIHTLLRAWNALHDGSRHTGHLQVAGEELAWWDTTGREDAPRLAPLAPLAWDLSLLTAFYALTYVLLKAHLTPSFLRIRQQPMTALTLHCVPTYGLWVYLCCRVVFWPEDAETDLHARTYGVSWASTLFLETYIASNLFQTLWSVVCGLAHRSSSINKIRKEQWGVPFRLDFFLHHAVSGLAFSLALLTGRFHFWAAFAGLCEVTNFPLAAFWLGKWCVRRPLAEERALRRLLAGKAAEDEKEEDEKAEQEEEEHCNAKSNADVHPMAELVADVFGQRLLRTADVVFGQLCAPVGGLLLWLAFIPCRLLLFPLWLALWARDTVTMLDVTTTSVPHPLHLPTSTTGSPALDTTVAVAEQLLYPLTTLLILALSCLWFQKIHAGVMKAFFGGKKTSEKKIEGSTGRSVSEPSTSRRPSLVSGTGETEDVEEVASSTTTSRAASTILPASTRTATSTSTSLHAPSGYDESNGTSTGMTPMSKKRLVVNARRRCNTSLGQLTCSS
jgi:hypothetical protein